MRMAPAPSSLVQYLSDSPAPIAAAPSGLRFTTCEENPINFAPRFAMEFATTGSLASNPSASYRASKSAQSFGREWFVDNC
jgi:hypothetical protein